MPAKPDRNVAAILAGALLVLASAVYHPFLTAATAAIYLVAWRGLRGKGHTHHLGRRRIGQMTLIAAGLWTATFVGLLILSVISFQLDAEPAMAGEGTKLRRQEQSQLIASLGQSLVATASIALLLYGLRTPRARRRSRRSYGEPTDPASPTDVVHRTGAYR